MTAFIMFLKIIWISALIKFTACKVFMEDYRLFGVLVENWGCPDRSAVKCDLIYVNFKAAFGQHLEIQQKNIKKNEDSNKNITSEDQRFLFMNMMKWEVKGQVLSEFIVSFWFTNFKRRANKTVHKISI